MQGRGKLFYQLIGVMLSIVALSSMVCGLVSMQTLKGMEEQLLAAFESAARGSASFPAWYYSQWLARVKRVLNEDYLLASLCALEVCRGTEPEALELLDRLETRLAYKEGYADYSFVYLYRSGILLGCGSAGEAAEAILFSELGVDSALFAGIIGAKPLMSNRILHTDSGFHGFLAANPLNAEALLIHAYFASSREDLPNVANLQNAQVYYYDQYGASLALQEDVSLREFYSFSDFDGFDRVFTAVEGPSRYFVSWATLDESLMKFVIYTPDTSYASRRTLTAVLIGAPILLFLGGICQAYFSARRFYRPIERLMARIPLEGQGHGSNEMALLEAALVRLETRYWEYEARLHSIEDARDSEDTRFARICAFIQERYSDPGLSATRVADAFGISTSALSRLFKRRCGIGYLDYVQLLRIEAARRLLLTTDMSVAAVSEAVGYANPMTMTRAFKRHLGLTPSELRG